MLRYFVVKENSLCLFKIRLLQCRVHPVHDIIKHCNFAVSFMVFYASLCKRIFLGNVVSKPYLLFKWWIALFLLSNQILSLMNHTLHSTGRTNKASKYWIYATHWGHILITIAVNLDAILVFARYTIQRSKIYMNKRHPHYESCHTTLKLSIALTATAYPLALFVTLIYWSFLFDFTQHYNWGLGFYINLAVHALQVRLSSLEKCLWNQICSAFWSTVYIPLLCLIYNDLC